MNKEYVSITGATGFIGFNVASKLLLAKKSNQNSYSCFFRTFQSMGILF